MTIDALPDDVLLEIFDFYVDQARRHVEQWRILVRVCRKWRIIVFGSPCRLKLQLLCDARTPVRKMLGIWPPFPIVIRSWSPRSGEDNIIAALEHNDRVCKIELEGVPSSLLEIFLAARQQPFPVLTHLKIWLNIHDEAPIIPNSFLGGSAPRLQYLEFRGIPFQGLPKLLFSTTDLVTLILLDIPHSGYFPPEAMVIALSALTRLDSFHLEFRSPRSYPDGGRRRPPPPTRSVLPAVTCFNFNGVSEYLEDLLARIDAPHLDDLNISLFHQLIFDMPQLTQFISRTPNLRPPDEARVLFKASKATVILPQISYRRVLLGISCRQSDWLLSSLQQLCSSLLPLISSLEYLYIDNQDEDSELLWHDDMENAQWLELLNNFTTVKTLYLSWGITRRIVPALQELDWGRATEVLPSLQSLFLEEIDPLGPVPEGIDKFVAARQRSGHSVAVSRWDKGQVEL